MRDSPRIRRLRTDLKAMETLQAESSIMEFSVTSQPRGGPPDGYLVRFRGRGLFRDDNSEVLMSNRHEVRVNLGASYPRMMPELQWLTPIFHPNISGSGIVCLGGYGTHWVPSLNLDELCGMLWDMIRYANYDIESPYNREAATWAQTHPGYDFPLDRRPIRDLVAGGLVPPSNSSPKPDMGAKGNAFGARPIEPDVVFLDDDDVEIVDAEIVEKDGPDIMFIE